MAKPKKSKLFKEPKFYPDDIVIGNDKMLPIEYIGNLFRVVEIFTYGNRGDSEPLAHVTPVDGGRRINFYIYKLDLHKPGFRRAIMEAIEQSDGASVLEPDGSPT